MIGVIGGLLTLSRDLAFEYDDRTCSAMSWLSKYFSLFFSYDRCTYGDVLWLMLQDGGSCIRFSALCLIFKI